VKQARKSYMKMLGTESGITWKQGVTISEPRLSSTGASWVIIFNHITRLVQEMEHRKAPDDQLLLPCGLIGSS
jgi:hypothetical protein